MSILLLLHINYFFVQGSTETELKSNNNNNLVIVDLTQDHFNAALTRNDLVLVVFYAPWCGYCKSLNSELIKAASDLKSKNIEGRIATVDATKEKSLALEHDIKAYPTLLLFRKGIYISSYKGARRSDAIVDYISDKAGPISKHVTDMDDLFKEINILRLRINRDNNNNNEEEEEEEEKHNENHENDNTNAINKGSGKKKEKKEFDLAFAAVGIFPSHVHGGSMNNAASNIFEESAITTPGLHYYKTENIEIAKYYNLDTDQCNVVVLALQDPTKVFTNTDIIRGDNNKEDDNDANRNVNSNEDNNKNKIYVAGKIHITSSSITHTITQQLKAYTIPPIIEFDEDTAAVIDSLPVRQHVLLFVHSNALMLYKNNMVPDEPTLTSLGLSLDNSKKNKNDAAISRITGLRQATLLSYKLLTQLDSLALRYRGRLIFIIVSSRQTSILQHFHYDEIQTPQVAIADITDSNRPRSYLMSTGKITDIFGGGFYDSTISPLPIEPTFLSRFLDQFEAGLLTPSLKTKPVENIKSDDNDDDDNDDNINNNSFVVGSITSIVGSQFDELVMKSPVSVLLLFHAPWCAHCKSLEPVFDDAASVIASKGYTDISFLRIDASTNDVPHDEIQILGYPTLYLFPLHNKTSPTLFQGERSTEDIVNFVIEHCSTEDAAMNVDGSTITTE